MIDGSGEIRLPRYATEEDLAWLALQERVAKLVGPLIAEAVRLYGVLPGVPKLTVTIAEVIARSPSCRSWT